MTTKVCQKDVTYWCRVVDDVLDASRAPTSYTDILSPLYPPVTRIFVATESHQETSDTIDASRNLSSSSAEWCLGCIDLYLLMITPTWADMTWDGKLFPLLKLLGVRMNASNGPSNADPIQTILKFQNLENDGCAMGGSGVASCLRYDHMRKETCCWAVIGLIAKVTVRIHRKWWNGCTGHVRVLHHSKYTSIGARLYQTPESANYAAWWHKRAYGIFSNSINNGKQPR